MLLSLTTFFFNLAETISQLQRRVTELEGQIQAKEQELRQAAEARKQLVKDDEDHLKAEFESERAGWSDKDPLYRGPQL